MKKQITILEVEDRVGKKSGKKYRVAQCVVRGDNVRVGELMVFRDDIKVEPGDWTAEFDVTVNFERQVSAELIGLQAIPGSKPAAKAA